jgi:3-dehydroquinate dehydratase / shikimate dehydrogenase
LAGGKIENAMNTLPFYVVTLRHERWEDALASAKKLPQDAIAELRLDLFPDRDPEAMVQALHGQCLVSCRRVSEGGQWPDQDEKARLAFLEQASRAKPAWIDLEWELPLPAWLAKGETQRLRSVHVASGVFDLDTRLQRLPEGEAYKWVGHALRLSDNARLKAPLAWAKERDIPLSAFLMGAKGIPSRVLQRVWGGAFTYAASDDGLAAAPGQIKIGTMTFWRTHCLDSDTKLYGVIGEPVLHSRSPTYHNERFHRASKNAVYLPLESSDASEACEALDALGILGLSITAPLKETLPAKLGLKGPQNTLWRRGQGEAWQAMNTDALALSQAITGFAQGPVMVLGDGGVAQTSVDVLKAMGFEVLQASRRQTLNIEEVRATEPIGVIQATSLGMKMGDTLPFPDLLAAAEPSLQWTVEWIYKEDTSFAAWARGRGLPLVEGAHLFLLQAEAQSRSFIEAFGQG